MIDGVSGMLDEVYHHQLPINLLINFNGSLFHQNDWNCVCSAPFLGFSIN